MMKSVLSSGVSRVVRQLKRSRKGAALLETALTVLLLMLMVIGIGGINVQIGAIEDSGRGLDEVSHTAVQLIEEEGGALSPASQDILLDMLAARTKAPEEDLLLRIVHVQRNVFTGDYVIINSYEMGALDRDEIVAVRSSPEANPGISLLGETIELDLGNEIMVFYMATVYRGVPRGVRSPEIYEQVNVMPVM